MILTERKRLAASVRPKSVENPEVSTLRELGVDIKPVDWQNASAAELDELFKGTETVICTCNGAGLLDQKHLIDAAKRNGIRRFIPSDFAIPVPHGVMNLHDTVRANQNILQYMLSDVDSRNLLSTSI